MGKHETASTRLDLLKLFWTLRAIAKDIQGEASRPPAEPETDSAYWYLPEIDADIVDIGMMEMLSSAARRELDFRRRVALMSQTLSTNLEDGKRLALGLPEEFKAEQVDCLETIVEAGWYIDRGCAEPPASPESINEAFRLAHERCDARLHRLASRFFALRELLPETEEAGTTKPSPADKRNAWIFEELWKGTTLEGIIMKLQQKPEDWERIYTAQGIRGAAQRYAKKHKLELPPKRKPGRPRVEKN